MADHSNQNEKKNKKGILCYKKTENNKRFYKRLNNLHKIKENMIEVHKNLNLIRLVFRGLVKSLAYIQSIPLGLHDPKINLSEALATTDIALASIGLLIGYSFCYQ